MDTDPYPVTDWLPLLFYGDDGADANLHIVTEIFSHPAELITGRELFFMTSANDRYTRETVEEQLGILQKSGLVTTVEGEEFTFYGLTDSGKQFVVDTRHYRGSDVMKGIYDAVDRPADIEEAYRAERPHHPPATDEYEERDTDSDAWEHARQQTRRTLTLTLERVDDQTLQARVVEGDDGRVLAEETITSDRVDWEVTDDYREMEVTERRGNIEDDDAYGIIVVEDAGNTINVKLSKNGEKWHSEMIQRCLYVFREPEDGRRPL